MVAKLRLVFSFSILFFSFYTFSQQNHWRRNTTKDRTSLQVMERLKVQDGQQFTIDEAAFGSMLKTVSSAKGNSRVVYFPNSDGEYVAFRVTETPVLAPALAAKYPAIKSYSGYSLSGNEQEIRFSLSHKGIQSMITDSHQGKRVFMHKTNSDQYLVYTRDSFSKRDQDFVCETKDAIADKGGFSALRPVDGQVLRTYRFAVSASGEYTAHHGGTVADALAAINATVTRINAVFEADLAVRLEVIADNDKVIYTDSDTDPYTGNFNAEAQNTLTDEIGEANYDIGHLFHKGPDGGNAGFIGRICVDGSKGSAYSAAQVPEGDFFDLDFVAHEVGHQLGANHTWSFESEGSQVQAEPASGTTIMGYAGITGNNNVALHSDDYFHYYSILQIITNLESKACGTEVALTNNPPVIDPVPDYIIPKSTAFVLTGNATDPDAADVLTYTWEQIDDGVVTQGTFGPTNPSGANFRSRKPKTDPSRYFPQLPSVVAGQLTQTTPGVNEAWETVSSIERSMNFALTVRDNAVGGGQVTTEFAKVQTVNAAGPFAVTSQASGGSVVAGEVEEIRWEVANTNLAPINTETVAIYLSTDGGSSFPLLLAEGVLNDGVHELIVPGVATSQARIMVKAEDNIFFAVNTTNFAIVESSVVLQFSDLEFNVCQPDEVSVPFVYETYSGFSETSTFSISGPAGLTASFSPASASANDTNVVMTLSNTGGVALGSYPIMIMATSASQTKQIELTLNLFDANFSEVPLVAPADGAVDISTGQVFEWEASSLYTSYDIEFATDAAFTTIVESATVLDNTYVPQGLQNLTSYFWRVKPKNECGEGVFGSAFLFTTVQQDCITKMGTGFPLEISASGTPVVTTTISFFEDLPLADLDVNLELDHTYLSDLVVTLTSPAGTTVTLLSNSCGQLQNVAVTFDDDASNFVCGGNPAISGTVRALGALNSFKGESIAGDWTLRISDTVPADGGSLKAFSLDVCVEGQFSPDEDGDGVFDADDACPGTDVGQEVDATGCPVFRFPSDNFEVSLESETCRSNNDGNILVVTYFPVTYTVTVSGSNFSTVTDTFTDTYELDGLSAGTYTICFNATDGGDVYQEMCFDVVISEPELLSVSSVVSARGDTLRLELEGADLYFVEFNGTTIQTNESELLLDLQKGANTLKVATGLECQGSYEEQFFLSEGVTVYPNPFEDVLKIYVTEPQSLRLEVYSLNGQQILNTQQNVSGVEATLDVSGLATGTYFLKVRGQTQNQTVKIMKR